MNQKAEVTTDENINIDNLDDDQQQEGQRDAGESGDGATEGGDDDSVVVTIGEEAPPTEEDEQASAPEWVKELRKTNREDKRRIRELEEQLKASTATETKPVQVGKKPTLEDHDYDAEKFEASLEQWYEQKRQADEQNAKAQADANAQQQAWEAKLNKYNEDKAKLKVSDFEDAEEFVRGTFSTVQQGIIIKGASNPEVLIYALGRNHAKAKELAAIKDPVEYAFAVAKLETQLKVTPRKAPPPERTVGGSGRSSGAIDSTLERLRAEAEKTGDMTKVLQYKRQQRSKQS